MTIDALKFINDALIGAGINYEFGEWSSSPIPSPYFIGEATEIEPMNEDGMQQTTLLLTGTSKNSWLELLESKEQIEELFPPVGGKVAMLTNGSALAIFFNSALNIPTDTMELKRIQINLTIKEWKVK